MSTLRLFVLHLLFSSRMKISFGEYEVSSHIICKILVIIRKLLLNIIFATILYLFNRFLLIIFMKKENKSSNVIHIKNNKNVKIENNKTIYEQRKQNRWPKRNVPRSVVEKYEPNGYESNELDKQSVVDEYQKIKITSKRSRRHVVQRNMHQKSRKIVHKVMTIPTSTIIFMQISLNLFGLSFY